MPTHDVPMLRDANNNLIPQYYDTVTNTFQPLTETTKVVIQSTGYQNGLPVDVKGATFASEALTLENVQSKTADFTFQNAVTSPSNGSEFTVGAYKDLTIEITGTSTSRTILFEAAGASGEYRAIIGVRNSDFNMGTQTTGNNESWTFSITGQKQIRIRVPSVTGGKLTIKGTAVS